MSIEHVNFIVMGKTGVGKSTLINAIFGEEFAKTNTGKPCTQHIEKFEKENYPIRIYDTRGLELNEQIQKEVLKDIDELICNNLLNNDQDNYIHMIVYCINTLSSRVEDLELDLIKKLSENCENNNIPVIICLTQSINKKKSENLINILKEQNFKNVKGIIPVLAENYSIEFDGVETTKDAYGILDLVNLIMNNLKESQKIAFKNAQEKKLEKIISNCKKIIAGFVTATIAESFSPIPISDSLMLIPTQVAMMTSITITFKVKVSKSILTALASTIISTIGATILGKTIASTIFKVIPGIGTFIGGSISSAIAGTLTTAIGMAYLKIMILVYKGEIDINELSNEKVIELMKKTFEEEYKKAKNK